MIDTFIKDLKQYLKYQNPLKDPSYWKRKDNEELPEEAIEIVFNVKNCYICNKWKYKEHFDIHPENTENDYKKGISNYCLRCINKKHKEQMYNSNRINIFKRLQTDPNYKVNDNVLRRYNIEYDIYDKNYVLM